MAKAGYELNIKKDYLRDLEKYPLPKGEEGEKYSREEGKVNNFNHRKNHDTKNPGEAKWIGLSYTVGSYESAIKTFVNKGTSVHYIVKEDGEIQQLVSDEHRAYAFGRGDFVYKSKMNLDLPQKIEVKVKAEEKEDEGALKEVNLMHNDMNSWGISVMFVNDAKSPYSDDQIEAGAHLMNHLCKEHKIDSKMVFGLGDWALGRHIAPGPFFPWDKLANAQKYYEVDYDFGVYSFVDRVEKPKKLIDLSNPEAIDPELVKELQGKFAKLGWAIDDIGAKPGELTPKTKAAMVNFNTHHTYNGNEYMKYNPDLESGWLKLYNDSSDPEGVALVGTWDENSENVLTDIIA